MPATPRTSTPKPNRSRRRPSAPRGGRPAALVRVVVPALARPLLLAGVSVAALLLANPPLLAKPLTGAPVMAPSAAAQAAAQAAASDAAKAAQKVQDQLKRATMAVQAAQASQQASRDAARAALKAMGSGIPDGLADGGLQVAPGATPGSSLWVGLKAPAALIEDERNKVKIEQTQQRAIATWQTFNVSENTDLTFDQQGHSDWTVLNRVLDNTAPSRILGNIKSDGQVLVINQNGIIFGAGAQINVGSLIASTLEVGPGLMPTSTGGYTASTIEWRSQNFLSNGLLGYEISQGSYVGIGNQAVATFSAFNGTNNGTVKVENGASVASTAGGFLLLTAPHVINAGHLSSPQGQVILTAAELALTLTISTGTGTDAIRYYDFNEGTAFLDHWWAAPDADVRGLVPLPQGLTNRSDYYVWNQATGLIEAPQGNIYLRSPGGNSPTLTSSGSGGGVTLGFGAAYNDGILSSTTSVSRNGSIMVQAGDVRLGTGSLLTILPDDGDETIPQSPTSLAAFRPSAIKITGGSRVEMEGGALLLAPGGTVQFHAMGTQNVYGLQTGTTAPSIVINDGAEINVAGLTDVWVPISENQVFIDPAKKNELRDTPVYRLGFLNGAQIYLDPRVSGVRDDGVAWIGSPLIDATAYYQLVGVKAERLMVKGGNVTFGTSSYAAGYTGPLANAIIRDGATVNIAGGSLSYEGGFIRTTQLIDASGHVVDISNADPNGNYVGVFNGFVRNHASWGITESWSDPLGRHAGHTMAAFTEGRDAGTVRLTAPSAVFDGTLIAHATAGINQIAAGKAGTGKSSVSGDARAVQGSGSELPAGGALILTPFGDVRITDGATPLPEGTWGGLTGGDISESGGYVLPTALAQALPTDRVGKVLLSDDFLSNSGLSQVAILSTTETPSGAPLDTGPSRLALAAITVEAGAQVTLNPGGIFQAEGTRIQIDGTITAPSGKILLRTDPGYIGGGAVRKPGDFDIVVNGTLDVAGRWVNDFGATPETMAGPGWLDGGTISMISAPNVQVNVTANNRTDVSGSILINPGAHLNLAGGGRVNTSGQFALTGKGGNLSLINETAYFRTNLTRATRGLAVPICDGEACVAATNPSAIAARIVFDPAQIEAHGFGGGGSFTLTTPEFAFGTGTPTVGSVLPLDFFSSAGFANYTINSTKTALIPSKWTGYAGYDAVLAIQTVTVGAGQTLSLVQSVLPTTDLSAAQRNALRDLATGGDVVSIVQGGVPTSAYDQKAANLTLGGALELHVAQGGTVTGAAGAALTVGGLFNEGTIRIAGGSVTQTLQLPSFYSSAVTNAGIGIHDYADIFTVNPDGSITPTAASKVTRSNGTAITNANLAGDFRVNGDGRGFYFLGLLDAGQGIVLANGSVTDLSGAVIRNPYAAAGAVDGRIVGGGSLTTGAAKGIDQRTYVVAQYQFGQSFIAQPGAVIDLSGASGTLNQPTSSGFRPTPVWSDGGTLALGAGYTLGGATIRAAGGSAAALGGTLQVALPTLTQNDPATPTAGIISADLIAAAGFDTLVAVGGLTSRGDVDLTLDRALFVTAQAFTGMLGTGTDTDKARIMAPVLSTGGALSITAPYIGLQSNIDDAPPVTTGTAGAGTITLKARQIDVTGAVRIDNSVSKMMLWAEGDVRLIGVDTSWKTSVDTANPTLKGALIVRNDLDIIAGQIYPTTGSTFTVTSAAVNGTIRFGRSGTTTPAAPYAAGANLLVQAVSIVQGGVLRVPFGSLTLGSNAALSGLAPATQTVTLADGSITSVSANGLSIPYGTTTDTIEWYFAPTSATALSGPPIKAMVLNGATITLAEGATVDLSGGGDVYAYEFVPGTGGSRDILSQYNNDQYSANYVGGVGYQYADKRQVYAIVPGLSDAPAAAYDPIYSANYGNLLSASGVGRRVWLDGGTGLKAGWYTLLPAQYALLPGGMRVVEQTGAKNVVAGTSHALLDGGLLVSGRYGDALTGASDTQVRLFSVQSQDVIRSYSNIVLTSGNDWTLARAAAQGLAAPRIGLDAGRLIFNPLTAMTVDATLLTTAAKGGRGAQVDISGKVIDVVSTNSSAGVTPGAIQLSVESLNNLQAESLMIGGTRTDNTDGTTTLTITSSSIVVANDADHALKMPEILFAVDDGVVNTTASRLELKDGATIIATGTMNDTRSGAYIVDARVEFIKAQAGSRDIYKPANSTAIGALLRVGNGPQRLVQRLRSENDPTREGVTGTPTGPDSLLSVGNVDLQGGAITLDTSHGLIVGSAAKLTGTDIALGAGALAFSSRPQASGVVVITPELLATLSQGERLALRAQTSIGFDNGSYDFKTIRFDAATLTALEGGAVTIKADSVGLGNVGTAGSATGGTGRLAIDTGELTFNGGTLATNGFGAGVGITARGGVYALGAAGGLDVGAANLTLTTPYIGDRGTAGKLDTAATQLTLKTTGDLVITAAGTTAVDVTKLTGVPGSTLTLSGGNVAINGTHLRATAGALKVSAANRLALSGGAVLEAPGFAQTFGDAADSKTQNAPGGLLSLSALGAGGLSLGDATLSVGGGSGDAGTLKLSSMVGAIDWGTAKMDGKGGAGGKGGTFAIETAGAFDLVALNTQVGALGFTGGYDVRTRSGDLVLGAGQTLVSGSVNLTADGGTVVVGGTIDTSGVEGGAIALYGAGGVTLGDGAKLDAHANGYASDDSRQAFAGDVTLGTGFLPGTTQTLADGSVTGTSGRISVAAGATIDVSARRPGDRLVRLMRNGVVNYSYVEGDLGGTVTFRAPVIDAGGGRQTVNVAVANGGSVVGARGVDLVGVKRWDLAAVAASNLYKGVVYDAASNTVTLDVSTDIDTANLDGSVTAVGGVNFLGDRGTGTVVEFAQDLDLSAAYGALGGLAARSDFTVRPGFDLTASGNIVLASNWNLGAGTVDLAGAARDGLMTLDPRLQTAGIITSGYILKAGAEGQLFDGYTKLTYRPGGSVRAGAPVLTLAAEGALELRGSVTDGFFTFRDQTDPTYRAKVGIVYNDYRMTLSGGINNGNANTVPQEWSTWTSTALPTYYVGLSVSTSQSLYMPVSQTIDNTLIPYSAAGNSPAALGNLPGNTGDAVGSAQIFPLLPDGTVVASSSYNLVAGTAASVDPTRINAATNATFSITGYSSYSTTGGTFTTGSLNDGLYVDGNVNYSSSRPGTTEGRVSFTDWLNRMFGGQYAGVKDTSVAVLNFGSASATTSPARARIMTLFLEFAAQYGLQRNSTDATVGYRYSSTSATDTTTTYIALPGKLFKQFVTEKLIPNQALIEADLRAGTAVPTPSLTSTTANGPVTIVRPLVRTGVGDIALGASGTVDLTGGPVMYVTSAGTPTATLPATGGNSAQLGGVAVYTAGHPSAAVSKILADPVSGAPVAVSAPAGTPAKSVFATPLATTVLGTFTYNRAGGYSNILVADLYDLTGGGDIAVTAGGDVLNRVDYSLNRGLTSSNNQPLLLAWAGTTVQRWRVNTLTTNGLLDSAINPQLFRAGLATLGGGDIRVRSGGVVKDLTVAADASRTSARATLADANSTNVLVTVGGGDIAMTAAADLLGLSVYAASGAVALTTSGSLGSGGLTRTGTSYIQSYVDAIGTIYSPLVQQPTYQQSQSRFYVDDATVDVNAVGNITLAGIDQLSGFYSDKAALNLVTDGSATISNTLSAGVASVIYPGTLTIAAIAGDIDLKTYAAPPGWQSYGSTPAQQALYNASSPSTIVLVPSPSGTLSLLAGHDIGKTTIAMLDADPYFLPGVFVGGSTNNTDNLSGTVGFPGYLSKLTDAQLKRQHNAVPTHTGDTVPNTIFAGNDIGDARIGLRLSVPKQTRVYAGRDILNMMLFGQNLTASDITRIAAGRDITATTTLTTGYLADYVTRRVAPTLLGNTFIVGGPGSLMVEAGRDLGPFLNSTDVRDYTVYNGKVVLRYPGGIVAIGNAWNAYLPEKSADITVQFGVAKGADYAALITTYLKPGSEANTLGGYSEKLIAWMQTNAREALVAAYGTADVSADQAYTAFVALPELKQRSFLINDVYFNELRAPSDPNGPSYLKYSRGYLAVNTLFPAERGYTKNSLEGGASDDNAVKLTGNLDLRLAAIETLYDSNISILGPGGRVLAGSVVSTAQQATRRNYAPILYDPDNLYAYSAVLTNNAIPSGFEGVLTQRGGNINTFTDGDFLLNQSRLFTVSGGDITMWSSNADLNAGQGAKTTPNFPPVLVRINEDLISRIDRTGATTGAGIAAFPPAPGEDMPTISLLAPRGTVDAGDAGVRSAGDVNVAALRVANADNFKVGGISTGIPTIAVPNVAGMAEAGKAAGQAAQQATAPAQAAPQAQPSIIIVEIIGFGGGGTPDAVTPAEDLPGDRPT